MIQIKKEIKPTGKRTKQKKKKENKVKILKSTFSTISINQSKPYISDSKFTNVL